MRKPSDEFKIDETNELLALVPGMRELLPEGVVRRVGGDGKQQIRPGLQVAATNKLVEAITGGGIPALAESAGLRELEEAMDPNVRALLEAMNKAMHLLGFDADQALKKLPENYKPLGRFISEAYVSAKKNYERVEDMIDDIRKKG